MSTIPLSCSITDFSPIFLGWESVFKALHTTGIDGVELVVGIKSRWSSKSLINLSKKYQLPILSLHQPIWSGLNFYFDEEFFTLATSLNVPYITIHPLPNCRVTDDKMKRYFEKLARAQEKYKVKVLLENLGQEYSTKFVGKIFQLSKSVGDLEELHRAAMLYNFGLTIDTSHLLDTHPQENMVFRNLAPFIKNIHLSSFTKNQTHMPLYMGDFAGKEFVSYLKNIKYQGNITFEIYYPSEFTFFSYDADVIRKSVLYLKTI